MNELVSFKEFRNRISIIDLATANGYRIDKKKGQKWPVLRNDILNDTIIIINPSTPANQGYFNPHNDKDKGTLVQFVRNRLGTIFNKTTGNDIKDINAILYNCLKIDPTSHKYYSAPPKNSFHLPEMASLTNIDYLQSRHLSKNIIFSHEFAGRIFNLVSATHINTCFPYCNAQDKVIAGEIRNHNYKMQLPGSDRANAVWFSNMPLITDNIVLTESPIDAMSYHALHGKLNSWYISFGGSIASGQIITLTLLMQPMILSQEMKMVGAFDNDSQGEKYQEKMKLIFPGIARAAPSSKDFNKDLENQLKNINSNRNIFQNTPRSTRFKR